MAALTAVYSRKMVNFLYTTREENYYSCKEMDHPKNVAPEIGGTGSSNSRKQHFYCFGKFLFPPFRLV